MVWQRTHKLVKEVLDACKSEIDEVGTIKNQIVRSSISVPVNVAEGFGGNKGKVFQNSLTNPLRGISFAMKIKKEHSVMNTRQKQAGEWLSDLFGLHGLPGLLGSRIVKAEYVITLSFIFFALVLLSTLPLQAKVTGNCNNCHTMHNSQNGQPVARGDAPWGGTGGSTDLISSLLIASCLGCHSSAVTNQSIRDFDGNKIPIVFNTGGYPTNPLAGGNFYSVSIDVDNTGHNIFPTNPEPNPPNGLDNTPPGGTTLGDQLTCAGTYGCHGHNGRQSGDMAIEDETKAIQGAHHGDDSPPLNGDLSDVAKNYRFLLGIAGKEDGDWEQETNTGHNEYKGATTFGATDTISFFCGECHGNFHSLDDVGNATPWLRHPTDILLPQTGEYGAYDPTTIYNNLVPVAYTDFNYPSRATAVVMCLSCHRAHASPYFKMMRWDYKGWPGVGSEGCDLSTGKHGCCNVCHSSKN